MWCMTLCGVLLSVSATNVYLVSLPPWYVTPHHLELWTAVFFSIAAGISALIVTPFSIFHLRDRAQTPGSAMAWIALGLGFGLFTPLFTGALFPLASIPIDYIHGEYPAGETASLVVDAILIGIRAFIIEGVPAVPTGIASGLLFAAMGYFIDRSNIVRDERTSQYLPWLTAAMLPLPVLLFALFGPPEIIQDIGLS